jgi:hypothetical protein
MGPSLTGTVLVPRTRIALRIRRVNGLPPLDTHWHLACPRRPYGTKRLQACFCWVLPPLSGERGVPPSALFLGSTIVPTQAFMRGIRRRIWFDVHRSRLLDDEVVLDVLHTGNGRSVMACGGLLSRSVHKAAELNDSLDRLGTDRE